MKNVFTTIFRYACPPHDMCPDYTLRHGRSLNCALFLTFANYVSNQLSKELVQYICYCLIVYTFLVYLHNVLCDYFKVITDVNHFHYAMSALVTLMLHVTLF